MDRDVPNLYDLESDLDAGRSNFASFLIGGTVVAFGLLAFLFYDGGAVNGDREANMTGSFQTITQAPAPQAAPGPVTPAR